MFTFQGLSNMTTITSSGLENGSIHGLHSGHLSSMSPFREACFPGLSSTIPQSLSSPIGITSAATHHSNQASLGELSRSLSRMNGQLNYGFQGMGAIHHSLPEVHNGATNGVPYNLSTVAPVGVNSNSRTAEAVENRHVHKVGSGNLNGHSFDRSSEGGKFGYLNCHC
jgi:hypothetical protein